MISGNDGTISPDNVGKSPYMTVKDVAAILDCDPRTIRNYLELGKLEGINPTERKWLITRTALDRFLGKAVPDETARTSLAPIVTDARQKHVDDLLAATKKWKEQIVVDLGDAVLVRDSLVPSLFTRVDAEVRWHEKGPLVWQVDHGGNVEVWLAIERREGLFSDLLEDVPAEVKSAHDAIKSKIAAGIKQVTETSDITVSVTDMPNLVIELAAQLDLVLATRAFEGRCRVCRQLDKLSSPVVTAGTSDEEQAPD